MIGRWRQALTDIWQHTPYGLDELTAGCPSCPPWTQWALETVAGYVYAAYLLYLIVAQAGFDWPRLTSGQRCPPCNRRRGGADRSRHMGQEGGGKPYAAFDIQWDTVEVPRRLYQWARTGALQDAFREWIGADVGIGLIFYGPRIHMDVREQDYTELKPDAW